jgi:protein-disulfide isomerase
MCCTFAQALDATDKFFPEVSNPVEHDIGLGLKTAPVVMVEYASLSCPHCSEYHKQILSQLKKEYVDTNKLYYVYRNFPTNNPSILAAMLARCHSEKSAKTVDILFESQNVWAFKGNYQDVLKSIMILGGMSEKQFDSCVSNQTLRDEIIKQAFEAAKSYDIKGTPALFVNGHLVKNSMSLDEIKTLINKEIKITQTNS